MRDIINVHNVQYIPKNAEYMKHFFYCWNLLQSAHTQTSMQRTQISLINTNNFNMTKKYYIESMNLVLSQNISELFEYANMDVELAGERCCSLRVALVLEQNDKY